jgi:hypothetical protein
MIESKQCRCCLGKTKFSECNIKHVCEEMLDGNICNNPKAIFGTTKISTRIRSLMDVIEELKKKNVETFWDGCPKKFKQCQSVFCSVLG